MQLQRDDLVKVTQRLRGQALRDSTQSGYLRECAAFESWGINMGFGTVLPSTVQNIEVYVAWLLTFKNLDASTIVTKLDAISDWHRYARGLGLNILNPCRTQTIRDLRETIESRHKKPSKAKLAWSINQVKLMLATGYTVEGLIHPEAPGGPRGTRTRLAIRRNWHARLCVVFLLVGMLRRNAASAIRVCYRIITDAVTGMHSVQFLPGSDVSIEWCDTARMRYVRINVDADKNTKGGKVRMAYLPELIEALDLECVRELEYYLIWMGPPSGSFLLHAPGQQFKAQDDSFAPTRKGQRTSAYSNWSGLIHRVYTTTFPTATDADSYGSHSGRKSLSQWLWDEGWPRRLIADAGGWFIKKDAVDLYFKTSRHVILRAVSHIGQGRPQ
jgi:hypothetical protein